MTQYRYTCYMTASNHLLAGAAISIIATNPLIAVPVAFASHFVLDALPHFGQKGNHGYTTIAKSRTQLTVALVDALLALSIAITLLYFGLYYTLAIALVALSPDFMWPFRYFFYERINIAPPGGAITRLHQSIQKYERPWGIMPEIILFVVFLAYIAAELF